MWHVMYIWLWAECMGTKKATKGIEDKPGVSGRNATGGKPTTSGRARRTTDKRPYSSKRQANTEQGRFSKEDRLAEDMAEEFRPITDFLSAGAERLTTELNKRQGTRSTRSKKKQ